jgi:hypothetical protein
VNHSAVVLLLSRIQAIIHSMETRCWRRNPTVESEVVLQASRMAFSAHFGSISSLVFVIVIRRPRRNLFPSPFTLTLFLQESPQNITHMFLSTLSVHQFSSPSCRMKCRLYGAVTSSAHYTAFRLTSHLCLILQSRYSLKTFWLNTVY